MQIENVINEMYSNLTEPNLTRNVKWEWNKNIHYSCDLLLYKVVLQTH
jgi:hypothetical protein